MSRTSSAIRSAVNGLATTQLTPAAFCSCEPTASPQPVITAIGICLLVCLISRASSQPLIPGMPTSVNTASNSISLNRDNASLPLSATQTSQFSPSRISRNRSLTKSSSSTTSSLVGSRSSDGSVLGDGTSCRTGASHSLGCFALFSATFATGRTTRNSVPLPYCDSTSIVPPCRLMIPKL